MVIENSGRNPGQPLADTVENQAQGGSGITCTEKGDVGNILVTHET